MESARAAKFAHCSSHYIIFWEDFTYTASKHSVPWWPRRIKNPAEAAHPALTPFHRGASSSCSSLQVLTWSAVGLIGMLCSLHCKNLGDARCAKEASNSFCTLQSSSPRAMVGPVPQQDLQDGCRTCLLEQVSMSFGSHFHLFQLQATWLLAKKKTLTKALRVFSWISVTFADLLRLVLERGFLKAVALSIKS